MYFIAVTITLHLEMEIGITITRDHVIDYDYRLPVSQDCNTHTISRKYLVELNHIKVRHRHWRGYSV